MSAKKSAPKSTAIAKLPDGRVAPGRGPRKGAPNAGRPPSEVRTLCLLAFAERIPELVRIARKGLEESDRLRAIDLLGKYAGLTNLEIGAATDGESAAIVVRVVRE